MFFYLVETLGILLIAGALFFTLGIGWGWLTWGRLKKSSIEWRNNCDRLNARIASLEDQADRAERVRHEIENEKLELIEEVASKNEYAVALETKLRETTEGMENAFGELEQREEEVVKSKLGAKEWRERAELFEGKLGDRISLIEQLNNRHEIQLRDKESEIGILKAKLLAAEQSNDSQRHEFAAMAKRLAAAGKLTSEEVKLKTRRQKPLRQPENDPVLVGNTDPVHPDDSPQLSLGLG